MASSSLDYFELLKEAKRAAPGARRARVKVAFLADASTQHLVPLLKALLRRDGIEAEVYEAGFDAVAQEAFALDSPLHAFRPDVVAVLNSTQALRAAYASFDGPPAEFAPAALARLKSVWDALKERTDAAVVQSTFALPYERVFGGFEPKAGASFPAAVAALNALIAAAAKDDARVLLWDLDCVSGWLGRRRWFDERLWLLAKAPCALDCLPHAADALAAVVRALAGGSIKCVVVDLDNVLWGGLVGDDGLEGIRLGELEDGRAFQAFQRWLLALKKRGVLLAVCSRNDPETARLPFRGHPDMILKESDFAAFTANFQSKADNLRAIRESLNIGFDAMLFLDDDPFERELVRGSLPGVVVPDLPEDPADFVKALSERSYFEAAQFTGEDARRAELYAAESKRRELQGSFATMDDYLRSLGMRARVGRFDAFHLPRIVQLMGRSNQFNLLTRRYGAADCERFMKDPSFHPFFVTLTDKLGDNGLIAAVVLRREGDALAVDEWVMSCRVLLRGVEQLTMNAIFARARSAGAARVVGRHRPTPKNALVGGLFAGFGFENTARGPDGASEWALDVARYAPKPVHIAVEED